MSSLDIYIEKKRILHNLQQEVGPIKMKFFKIRSKKIVSQQDGKNRTHHTIQNHLGSRKYS